LIDKFDKEIGVVAIGMYDLATGPSHQDFVIKMKKVRKKEKMKIKMMNRKEWNLED